MKKLARVVLVATMAVGMAAPAMAGHTEACQTDPVLSIGLNTPDGCTHPDNQAQHCEIWVQSDAVLADGICQNF